MIIHVCLRQNTCGILCYFFLVCKVNEAFAAQYIAVEKELGLDRGKTNVNGGAIGKFVSLSVYCPCLSLPSFLITSILLPSSHLLSPFTFLQPTLLLSFLYYPPPFFYVFFCICSFYCLPLPLSSFV